MKIGRDVETVPGAAMNAANATGGKDRDTSQMSGDHRCATVVAGAKAILDLPGTFEVLETLGVPVIAVGQDELPAFWSRRSGLAAPLRMDDAAGIAAAHRMRALLGIAGGQLVANPILPAAEIPRDEMLPVIEAALSEAKARGISAKTVTLFCCNACSS